MSPDGSNSDNFLGKSFENNPNSSDPSNGCWDASSGEVVGSEAAIELGRVAGEERWQNTHNAHCFY